MLFADNGDRPGVGYLNRSLSVFSSKEHNRNPTSVDFPSTDCKRKSDNSTEVKHWKRWPTKKCLTYRRSPKYKSNEQSETTTILGKRKVNSLNNLGFFPFSENLLPVLRTICFTGPVSGKARSWGRRQTVEYWRSS